MRNDGNAVGDSYITSTGCASRRSRNAGNEMKMLSSSSSARYKPVRTGSAEAEHNKHGASSQRHSSCEQNEPPLRLADVKDPDHSHWNKRTLSSTRNNSHFNTFPAVMLAWRSNGSRRFHKRGSGNRAITSSVEEKPLRVQTLYTDMNMKRCWCQFKINK